PMRMEYPNAIPDQATGVIDAVSLAANERETGRHLQVGACDLEAPALQAIQDGLVYALASPEHWLKGYIAFRLLARHAQAGRPIPPGWWNPGALIVDRANVADISARPKDEAARTRWFPSEGGAQFANP